VPEFCTCGVQLPPDARFCHKCGKPQYDYPGLVEETPAPPPLPVMQAATPPPPEISFHNRLAVRIGFFVALILFIPFMFLQLIPFLPLLIAFLAGFFAVYRYCKSTGHSLSIRSGARMGWITGIFSFGIVAVFITFIMAVASTQAPTADRLREYQGPFFHLRSDQIEAVAKLFQDPASLAQAIAVTLLMFFVILTALPMLGGALGAKVLAKE
jgi:hypothetical protein